MRDDDVSYIVIERDKGGSVSSFVIGALVGAGLALLFAPQSGAETQVDVPLVLFCSWRNSRSMRLANPLTDCVPMPASTFCNPGRGVPLVSNAVAVLYDATRICAGADAHHQAMAAAAAIHLTNRVMD
jgi:hypothetical protein